MRRGSDRETPSDFDYLLPASTPLQLALLLADAGIPVAPEGLPQGALDELGFGEPSTDTENIERAWELLPDARVGVPAQVVSRICKTLSAEVTALLSHYRAGKRMKADDTASGADLRGIDPDVSGVPAERDAAPAFASAVVFSPAPKDAGGTAVTSAPRTSDFGGSGEMTLSTGAFENGSIAGLPREAADGLPDGFRLKEDGVYRRQAGNDDARPEWTKVCSPIRVIALTRDRSGEGWGRLVEITDRDGGKHLWAIPAELFAGDGLEVRRECLRLGLDLASGTKARNAFMDLLMQWRPDARAITADRLGWADESCSAFVLGDGRVIGAEHVVYQQANAPAAAAEIKAAGTGEDWRDAVATLCVGNPLMLFSVSLAFAGVLLEPLGLDGGGVHLRGASSRGKSTAQRVAVSVWGSPRFLQTWRATANGLEGVATACNSTVLALDEMGEVSGREAGAAAYMLGNGAGKARADRSGRARPVARWRVMILSSGEIGLADKVAEAGGRPAAGQMVRLLDIAADNFSFGAFDELHGAVDGATFADRAKAAAAEQYGTAGPAFVKQYLKDPEHALAAARMFREKFKVAAVERFSLDAEGQVSRAVDRLSLVAAAGEMATVWGLTGWKPGAALDAALIVLGLWLDGRGGSGAAEAGEAVERTRAFIVAHGASRFEEIDGAGERPVINRAGWKHGNLYYIPPTAWAEIHRGRRSEASRATRSRRGLPRRAQPGPPHEEIAAGGFRTPELLRSKSRNSRGRR